jgi:hypothetical protein
MDFNDIACGYPLSLLKFVTPTETFEDFNSFQNVSNGVANPVTLAALC